MTRMQPALLLARILIPLLLMTLPGNTARPHQVDLALQAAHRDLDAGAPLSAAEKIAAAAQGLPRRADLWELAGQYALQGGDPAAARTYFEQAISPGTLTPTPPSS